MKVVITASLHQATVGDGARPWTCNECCILRARWAALVCLLWCGTLCNATSYVWLPVWCS